MSQSLSNPYRTKEFKELFDHWNKKLVESGHDEIENFNRRQDPILKRYHTLKLNERDIDDILEREAYHRAARHFIYEYKFESDEDKKIWELHTEGLSVRKIAKELIKGKSTICNIVRKIRNEMKKTWKKPL